MIIDEYKSDSTIIRIDDRDIGTKEENKEIIDILLSLTIRKAYVNEIKDFDAHMWRLLRSTSRI